MNALTICFFLSTVSTLIEMVWGHSNLAYPFPYNPVSCKSTEHWCNGACPPVWTSGWAAARNSPRRPSATWRRGQRVVIVYHKNNHRGGIYRRSLVPVKKMYDRTWHRRGAFEWGCWSQGEFKCGRRPFCGTDKYGRAYRTETTIPRIFPDGDYVFVQSWYGGMNWQNTRPKFPDYTSCAFVRIRGGWSSEMHQPLFRPGNSRTALRTGKCETGKLWLGQCGGAPCKRHGFLLARPIPFKQGRKPAYLRRSWYAGSRNSNKRLNQGNKDWKQKQRQNRMQHRKNRRRTHLKRRTGKFQRFRTESSQVREPENNEDVEEDSDVDR